eukprot:g2966.t1
MAAGDQVSPASKLGKDKFDESPRRESLREKIRVQPFIIGIAGGTASGKTTVCTQLMQARGRRSVVC